MLQVRVELNLVDSWWNSASLQNPLEMLWKVVRHSNRFGQALVLDLLHLLPLGLMFLLGFAEERRMNEIEIHIIHTKFLQAGLESTRDVGDVGDDFGDNVQLLAGDA